MGLGGGGSIYIYIYIYIYMYIYCDLHFHFHSHVSEYQGHVKHMSSPVAIVAPEGFGWHQSIERDQSKENQLIECVAAQVVVVGDEGRPSQEFLLQWYQHW